MANGGEERPSGVAGGPKSRDRIDHTVDPDLIAEIQSAAEEAASSSMQDLVAFCNELRGQGVKEPPEVEVSEEHTARDDGSH